MAGWSANPGAAGCQDGSVATGPTFTDPACTLTMGAAETVTASMDGIVGVDNVLGGNADIVAQVNGSTKLSFQPPGTESMLVPYGATVLVHPITSNTVSFSGDCAGSGATISPAPSPQIGEDCTFTMSPGDSVVGPGQPSVIVTG